MTKKELIALLSPFPDDTIILYEADGQMLKAEELEVSPMWPMGEPDNAWQRESWREWDGKNPEEVKQICIL